MPANVYSKNALTILNGMKKLVLANVIRIIRVVHKERNGPIRYVNVLNHVLMVFVLPQKFGILNLVVVFVA